MLFGSLFSGIGGFDLGLERAGLRVGWQVEKNEWCREVLKKHWPKVPCHYDITKIDWRNIPRVDLVCGGFPCQPFSLAGKRRGVADDRYLWREVVRCVDALRPTWFLGENVPGLINLALDQVCTDLEGLGYAVWPVCVPACAVDAPHIRQRVFIVAHHDGKRKLQPKGHEPEQRGWTIDSREAVADAESGKKRGPGKASREQSGTPGRRSAQSLSNTTYPDSQQTGRTSEPWEKYSKWGTEPNVGRVAHGVPRRMDRLRGLGNAVVPQVAEQIGRMILAADQVAL